MRRALSRSGRAVLALVALAPAAARADAPTWIAWSAPAECQNTAEVERRLESLLGYAVDEGSLPPTRVQMGWSAQRGWEVRVTVQLAAGARERALDAPSCADAFDVVALSLALILDPSFAEPTPAAEQPDAAPAGGAEVELAAAPPEPPFTPPPVQARPVAAEPGEGAAPASRARRVTLELGGGALTDLGVFPVPQFGAALRLGLRHRSLLLELEGAGLASESTRFDGAEYPVNFYTVFGAVRACLAPRFGERLAWAACAGGELGSLGTHEQGGVSRRAGGTWLAAEASTGPEFTATRGLRAFARVRAVSPLIRHEFFLSGGTLAYTLPWLSPQIEVGVSVDVTDFEVGGH